VLGLISDGFSCRCGIWFFFEGRCFGVVEFFLSLSIFGRELTFFSRVFFKSF